MATYTKKKCPYCHRTYSFMPGRGTSLFGSPLRVCNSCGKGFIDKEYREIAIDGVRKADTKKVSPASIILFIVSLVPICFVVYAELSGFFSAGFIFGEGRWGFIGMLAFSLLWVGVICSEVLGYKKRLALLEKEKEASIARLRDPAYRQALWYAHINVPSLETLQKLENENICDAKKPVKPVWNLWPDKGSRSAIILAVLFLVFAAVTILLTRASN